VSDPYVDTDVIIRLLTGDDLAKQAASTTLFEAVERGEATVTAPDTVIADAVYVLASPRLYNVPRSEVAAMLSRLLRLPGFRVKNRRVVLAALALYGSRNLDFGDAMIAAAMRQDGSRELYSYDAGFDRLPDITRREPSQLR